jgi:hypothetical protein
MGKKGKKIEKKPEVAKSGKNLFRVNRTIKTISKSSKMLLCAHDEKQFMRDVCHNIVETGGFRLAWIGFAENDKKKSVRPMAQYGFEEGYLDGINLTWADEDIGHGADRNLHPDGEAGYIKEHTKGPGNGALAGKRGEKGIRLKRVASFIS